MIAFRNQRVLVVAPHPDDEVFGCGGLIHRVKREGGKVFVLYMTVGSTKDFSKKGVSTKEERITEIEKVARFLRFDGWRIAFPGDEYHLRLDALAQFDLIEEIQRGKNISLEVTKPTMMVAPSASDYNQDHRAVNAAVITAARPAPVSFKSFQRIVLTYEFPYSSWSLDDIIPVPNFFVDLAREDLRAKTQALGQYKSQLKSNTSPLSVHGVKALAALRGLQCGTDAAEAFFVRRFVL